MRTTTAELWIGPAQRSEFMGSDVGMNSTHHAILRENSTPGWILVPGTLYDDDPPDITQRIVWIPTERVIEDGLLLLAVHALSLQPVVESLERVVGGDITARHLDLCDFGDGHLPEAVYASCREAFVRAHLAVMAFEGSIVMRHLAVLSQYSMDLEVCGSQFTRFRGADGEIHTTGTLPPEQPLD